MKFIFQCTCGRGRGEGEKLSKVAHEEHICPNAVLIHNESHTCDCCASCTVLCLPLKCIRDKNKIQHIAQLYTNCDFDKKENK